MMRLLHRLQRLPIRARKWATAQSRALGLMGRAIDRMSPSARFAFLKHPGPHSPGGRSYLRASRLEQRALNRNAALALGVPLTAIGLTIAHSRWRRRRRKMR